MSLQVYYRPSTFEEMVGNKEAIESIKSVINRDKPPSTYLFTGPGGVGKTTAARILAKELGVHESDFSEQNASDDRGIDAVRKLSQNMKFSPLHGKRKFILLDEAHCFFADTLISTIKGQKTIDSVKAGDVIFNLNGIDSVEKVFINKVPLDYVAKINKSDGSHTFCSKDHGYYLNGEWVEAKDLTNHVLLNYKCTDFLQSGCWKQRIEDSNRNRWKKSLFENETKTRQEERISFEMERVESVEIYERGSNDESFSGVIGDKERNQGYVEFYDLHVKENHSYIANDNMVHNSLTKPSQEALLKTLEEPPDYVFIAICTTNPEVLKQTFKRRCHHYDLQPLNFNELSFLIKRTLKAEKVPLQSFNIKVAEKIIEFAEGSAGQCMKLLDMVIDMKSTSNALKTLEAVGMGTGSPEVLDICRLLIDQKLNDKTRWMRISQVLKDLKTDGESARRPILGYLTTVLISSGRPDVAYVMECFLENYYDTGKSGLALSCFNACHKE